MPGLSLDTETDGFVVVEEVLRTFLSRPDEATFVVPTAACQNALMHYVKGGDGGTHYSEPSNRPTTGTFMSLKKSIVTVHAPRQTLTYRPDIDSDKEVRLTVNASLARALDPALENLAFEGPEDDDAEFDVHIDDAGAVADETLGGGEDVVQADAEADFLDDLVGIFGVDVIGQRVDARLLEVFWGDLDQVGDCGLARVLVKLLTIGSLAFFRAAISIRASLLRTWKMECRHVISDCYHVEALTHKDVHGRSKKIHILSQPKGW